MFPSYVYQLESAGKLPKRPRGAMTVEFVRALGEYVLRSKGSLPEEAVRLLKKLDSAGGQ